MWGRHSDEEAVWCSSRYLAVRSYSIDPPGLGSATAYPDVGGNTTAGVWSSVTVGRHDTHQPLRSNPPKMNRLLRDDNDDSLPFVYLGMASFSPMTRRQPSLESDVRRGDCNDVSAQRPPGPGHANDHNGRDPLAGDQDAEHDGDMTDAARSWHADSVTALGLRCARWPSV